MSKGTKIQKYTLKGEGNKKKKRNNLKSADFLLFALTLALVIFGIAMVFSASYYWSIDKTGNPYTFLIKDIIWAITGGGMMVATMVIDYHKYKKIAPYLMGVAVTLLILVLFVGQEINGAKRWIGLGGITIMPGEICKICVILFIAGFLCKDTRKITYWRKGILPILSICAIVFGLIMKQPNMSTGITVLAIIIGMMFVAGIKMRDLIIIMTIGAAAGSALIVLGGGYRMNRVSSFIDPFADALGDGYQVVQGLLALGSGGLRGLGIGDSMQKNLYLPEPQNDFILAIIGEEMGFLVILLLMCAYLLLVARGINVAIKAPDRFGMLVASGITMMIGIQVLLNVAVVTSSMPPTGVTLPFVSYGGNALWLFMGSMGILLNISRHSPKEKVVTDKGSSEFVEPTYLMQSEAMIKHSPMFRNISTSQKQ